MSSREPKGSPWPSQESDAWETEVHERAQRFVYPTTPDLVRSLRVRTPTSDAPSRPGREVVLRRLAWGLAVLLLVVAALSAVEPVRAWVAEVLRLGAVRIFVQPPEQNVPLPLATATISPAARYTPAPLNWLGETTLSQAAKQLPFVIRLPAWPLDLGPPDHVFRQNLAGPALLLVWMDPQEPRRVRLSLHALAEEAIVHKFAPVAVTTTQVNGQEALWTDGPYLVRIDRGDTALQRLITGHVLIWTDADVTYRLETDLAVEEAVRVAESLRPWMQDQ